MICSSLSIGPIYAILRQILTSQLALCLRGFLERPRAAPSRVSKGLWSTQPLRVSDAPGLGRRGGAQAAARGAIREKRYNLPEPGVHYTHHGPMYQRIACVRVSDHESFEQPDKVTHGV